MSPAAALLVCAAVAFAVGSALAAIWRRRVPVADRWAQTAFVVVAVAALPLAVGGDVRDAYRSLRGDGAASTARTVTETLTPPSESVERTVTERPTGTETATKTVSSPAVRTTQTVTADRERRTWDDVLSPGGLLLLRAALAILVAFLTAAAVQRMLLGNFAVKVGQLDIPAITRSAVEAAAAKLGQGFLDAIAKLESPSAQVPLPEFVWARDTRLRFIAFYIELQQAVRRLAERVGLDHDRAPAALVGSLQERGVITGAQAVGYLELLRYGSEVTAGAPVDDEAQQWLSSQKGGLAVLYQLNTTEASSVSVTLGLRRESPVPGVPGPTFGPVGPPVAHAGETVMIEVSLLNTSGVTIRRVRLTDAATGQPIAESNEPLPARSGSQSFTMIRTVPPGAVGSWTAEIEVGWEDEDDFRGRRRDTLVVEVVEGR